MNMPGDHIDAVKADFETALNSLLHAMGQARLAVPTREETYALVETLAHLGLAVESLKDELKAHPAPEWSEGWQ